MGYPKMDGSKWKILLKSMICRYAILGNLYIYIYVPWNNKPPTISTISNSRFLALGFVNIVEGSLEVKLPTIWTDEKQSRAEAERRGRLEERRSEEKE